MYSCADSKLKQTNQIDMIQNLGPYLNNITFSF
jgi:hypothetical protein